MVDALLYDNNDVDRRQNVVYDNNVNNTNKSDAMDTGDENKDTTEIESKKDIEIEEGTTQGQEENQEESKKRSSTPKDQDPVPKKLCVERCPEQDSLSKEAYAKKPRCKPELAKKVYEKMLESLIKSYVSGISEVDKNSLASSVGYKNPRSDAILAATKLGNDLGTFVKSKNMYSLTSIEKKFKTFMNALGLSFPAVTAESFWNTLKDGEWHFEQELLKNTGYSKPKSIRFVEMKNALNNLGWLEYDGEGTEKKYRFSNKVFPFPRLQT